MGLPALGLALGAQWLNNKSQSNQNESSRQFELQQYQRSRRDNLADWNRNNAYNDPSAQMKRLKMAGLNPNLIYGSSSGGASGQASPIKSSSSGTPQFLPSKYEGFANTLSQFYDTQVKQAQVDNLRADNTVKLETAALTQAKRLNTEIGTKRSAFDLNFEKKLATVSANARQENLRLLSNNADKTLADNNRATERLNFDTQKIEEQTKLLRKQIVGQGKSNELKQLDINLRKKGIMPSDPLYMRALGQLLGGSNLRNIINN